MNVLTRDEVKAGMCARVTGKGAKMMDADGKGWEFHQILFVDHRALVADSRNSCKS